MATISIADDDARVQYTQAVNGLDNDPSPAATELTIDFPFFDLDDIEVIKTTGAGVDTVLSRGTGTGTFTVNGTSVDDGYSGGNVQLHDTDAATDTTYTIYRDIAVARTTDFPTSGPFNISALNTELDKIIAIEQELETKITRTLRLAESDATADVSLPNLDTRKGKTLAFNATTGAVEAGPSVTGVTTVAALSADIATLADIEDGTVATNAISGTAAIASDVTTVAGISGNVSTVAGISSDVTAVAADATDIGTVATNIASVNTVATNIADVITVANDLNEAISEVETVADDLNEAISEIEVVANNIANVNAVGAIDSDVTTVSGISANVTTTAGISGNVTTVAGIAPNVTTVAGVSANVTTVAGVSADVTTVAGISSDVTTAATNNANITTVAGAISNVNAVGTDITNVNTVATNIADVNNFADTYFISAIAPSSPTTGDLWFDTANSIMKVYDGSGFVNAGSSVNGTSERQTYTATAGQTTFAATYDAGYVDVYLNGVKLIAGTDFTATNGTSIVLTTGAALNDTVDIVAYGTFNLLNQGATLSSLGIANHDNLTVDASGNVDVNGDLTVDTNTLYVDSTNNRVGVGTASLGSMNTYGDGLTVATSSVSGSAGITVYSTANTGYGSVYFGDPDDTKIGWLEYDHNNDNLDFGTNNARRMTCDSSGNLLVGTTSNTIYSSSSEAGSQIGDGYIATARAATVAYLNRLTSDGSIVEFRKDGSTVGSIGTWGGGFFVGSPSATDAYLYFGNSYVAPSTTSGFRDNAIDLGNGSARYDDIYATNGTIQTSDVNEKQQIASLTDAEMTAAKAISALFKTFKWNDAVAEKGDAARTHTGVIAQDVQAAMTAAGLDAGDYAFFISSTWWETQTEVPAVEAVAEVLDDDGNVVTEAVEAADAYTRTDTYDTAEEAPEGAVERTRLGIRYPELLAFIGAATEQRLADIETRLTALENA